MFRHGLFLAAALWGLPAPSLPAGELAPLPAEPAAAEGNPATPEKLALGKLLFFDPRLSGDGDMSCATCHVPEKGFADGLPVGRGRGGKALPRSTPPLWNIGRLQPLMWDGRAATLEEQALLPLLNPEEMHQDLAKLGEKLGAVPEYRRRFAAAFPGEWGPITPENTARALAVYQRSLVSGGGALDRFLAGEKEALSPLARRGHELFVGEAGCVRCHHGPLLSDGKFHRLGIGGAGDRGRELVSGAAEDRYRFRTPSLRNVARTPPYMHDGSLKTLEEVVEFYFRHVPRKGPEGLPLDLEPLLGLSYSEIDAVVAFLRALDGELPAVRPPEIP